MVSQLTWPRASDHLATVGCKRGWCTLERMGFRRCALFAMALCAGCSADVKTSLLISIEHGAGARVPDQLRLALSDANAVLLRWKLVPTAGVLKPESAKRLGTLTIEMDDAAGDVRLVVAGLIAGQPQSEGKKGVSLPSEQRKSSLCSQYPLSFTSLGPSLPPLTNACNPR